jgi:uncharacterized protein YukE
MSQPLVGPLPYPDLPEQPVFPSWCTAWGAYDVPRIWDIVRTENDHLGWEQVNGFRQLSDLLVDQYRRLRAQWANLSDAWQGTAANVYLARLDAFSLSLLSDAHCAATTANALHDIMSTYADARTKIDRLTDRWENVTSDWIPEWWDEAAAELNTEAAQVMFRTDLAVRDHRGRIIIPDRFTWTTDHPAIETSQTDSNESSTPRGSVPAVPGHHATNVTGDGPWLAQSPPTTPASPGQPVSMLPIPPGNPYTPYGGAYILPGPGVGRDGYIVPMPGPTSLAPTIGGFGPNGNSGTGAVGAGMIPLPVNTPQTTGGRDSGHLYRRRANYVWQVGKGVSPIIEPIPSETVIPNLPSAQQEEAFKEWFAELAYPWRNGGRGNEPHVILRRATT